MIERYGKSFDIFRIKRSLSELDSIIEKCHADSDRFAVDETDGGVCRVCGSRDGKHLVTVYSKYYYECADCGSVYLYGLPDYQSMYQGEDEVNGNFYIGEEIYNDRVQMIAEPKVEWIMDVCKRENISVDSWLDIGSGGGEILFSLKEKGISAIGIESDRIEHRFSLEKGLDVRNLRVDFKSREVEKLIQNADAISFFNVLEHIPEPQKFIDYIYDNMKTGGLMVFEVPRHPSLASFANVTGRDFAYRHIAPPGHLTVFSEAGIERLLSGRFQILGKWCFGQGYVDIINNAMLWSKERENSLYEKVLNISNDVQKAVDEHGLADQIMVITRKSYNLLSAGEFL